MIGKLAGWLMYFPALPNCMLMFQNSVGGLSTMPFTLQDLVFPWPGFQCAGSVHHAQYEQSLYRGLPLRSHFPGC